MAKTLRVRTATGWTTKDAADTPENRLTAEDVDDNFLAVDAHREVSATYQVGAGGDYATINAALTAVCRLRPVYVAGGYRVTLNLVAGFVMAEQVLVDGIDLSWITITGTDASTTITRSALTALMGTRYPAFGAQNGGALPVVNQQFAMDASGTASSRDGVHLYRGSCGIIFGGVTGAGGIGMYVFDSSVAEARGADFSGAGTLGINVVGGSRVNATSANGQKGGTPSSLDFVVSQGGIINAASATGGLSQTANTVTASGIIFQ